MSNPLPRSEAELVAALAADSSPLPMLRDQLARIRASLDQRFVDGDDIRALVTERAAYIDSLMRCIWTHHRLDRQPDVALIAVGGYGRGELHPHSDIDLLILLRDDGTHERIDGTLEAFVTFLWDTGLAIGLGTRTVEQCRAAAEEDITIATNIMESRTLIGAADLLPTLAAATGPDRIWPSATFFRAKWDEQIARHRKFNNTEYNLEPNVKGCPGGLRDVQTIGWVAKRHFQAGSTSELVSRGFLTQEEFDTLSAGQDFLWRIRYALHMLADRAEDRLLFDFQLSIARLFGYKDDERGLAVEHFMKDYFRWVLKLGVLNEMLVQLFDEAILRACEPVHLYEINNRFRVRNGYIEVTHDNVFRIAPWAMIEMFVLIAQHDFIVGLRASTVRLIHEHRRTIDADYRADPRANKLFLQLLGSPYRVATQLDRMKRYGILGRFIPEFGRIVGQTQHDMFHVYSVDSHTIRVVRNMRRFSHSDAGENFPTVAFAVTRLPKVELLYLAGLFHDIAKGRGGDHSQLGAQDAHDFCIRLGLTTREANLVAWLVVNHLVMSTTAQRKDISDPEVINAFAQLVSDQVRLDYLYALTVADITATNPTLWNSWRASLLHGLYLNTKRALRRGLENPVDSGQRMEEIRHAALETLHADGVADAAVQSLWQQMGDAYFLRETARDIAWHTRAILQRASPEEPVVLLKEAGSRFAPVTQIFIYMRDRDYLFAVITATMEQLGLNVHGARVYSSADDHTLDTFFVLEQDGKPVHVNPRRAEEVRNKLLQHLGSGEHYLDIVRRHTPRALKHFTVPTQTRMEIDADKGYSMLEVMTPDRSGLLARIGRVFLEFGIKVRNARITTLGERVEDVFFITDANHQPIHDDATAAALQQAICAALDQDATGGASAIRQVQS